MIFFPGWLCHCKGLFIPVWHEIHRSKFYSWHIDNWPIGQWVINYLHHSQHSIQCMSIIFFQREFIIIYNSNPFRQNKLTLRLRRLLSGCVTCIESSLCTLLRTYERSNCRLAVSPVIPCIMTSEDQQQGNCWWHHKILPRVSGYYTNWHQ